MSPRVMLTGGSGDLATVLAQPLANKGWQVLRLDIRPPQDQAGTHIQASVLDRPALEAAIADVDVVVHIAAWHGIHEVRGWKTQDEFWHLNVSGTYHVLQACVERHVDKLVYLSSTSVEDQKSFYGLTKRLGEQICHEYAERYGLNAIILRPRAFIPHWNREAYENYIEWARWFWGGAVHISDVAQAIEKSLERLMQSCIPQPLTLTVDGAFEYTAQDLEQWDADGPGSTFRKHYREFESLAQQFDLDITVKPKPIDIAETVAQLDYHPRFSLRSLLKELSAFGEDGPPGPYD